MISSRIIGVYRSCPRVCRAIAQQTKKAYPRLLRQLPRSSELRAFQVFGARSLPERVFVLAPSRITAFLHGLRVVTLSSAQHAIQFSCGNQNASKFSHRVNFPGVEEPVRPACVLSK